MWNMSGKERIYYDYNLEQFLQNLKKNDIILTIASFNDYADKFLHRMGLDSYFSYIVGNSKSCSKVVQIEEIMTRFPNVMKEEILFFDDLESNCTDVRNFQIESIQVCRNQGIKFEYFIDNKK
jgi:predicted phosphatase